MKFGKYMNICESSKEFIMDVLTIDDPINKDYIEDEDNKKEAEKNLRELRKAIRFQKKDIKSWEMKRFSEDNVEAAEAILDDLQVSLKKWEESLVAPPPEPVKEPDEEPKPEQPIPGEEPKDKPEEKPKDKEDKPKDDGKPEEEEEERGAGLVNEI